jgi:hypothetical protein
VGLTEDYQHAVAELTREPDSFELLPLALVRACVQVLPVDGAGVSMTESLRVPLAASDAVVARAERLQTTLGEGPCLSAASEEAALMADREQLQRRWPFFFSELTGTTPYLSVASIPLRLSGGQAFGAMDLYSTDPAGDRFGPLEAIEAAVAGPAAVLLMDAPQRLSPSGVTMPVWLDNDPVNQRMDVWVAVGLMMAGVGLGNDDALAALRGYAYSHALSLDEVASRMLRRELGPAEVRAQTGA